MSPTDAMHSVRRMTLRVPLAGLTAMLLGLIACGGKNTGAADSTGNAPAATSTPAAQPTPAATAADTTKSGGMSNMAGMAMTGDPDHDFLRMMMDHHKGLIAMAHPTIESKEKLAVKPLAKRLDSEQDKDMDKMSTMLDSLYKDNYTPMVMPDNKAMADQLASKSGAAYDTTFMQDVVKHHEEALKMIDAYLPKAKQPAIKAMAEQMKSLQQREIAELRKQLGSAAP